MGMWYLIANYTAITLEQTLLFVFQHEVSLTCDPALLLSLHISRVEGPSVPLTEAAALDPSSHARKRPSSSVSSSAV